MRRLVPIGMLLPSAFLNSLIYIDFSTRRPPDVLEQPSQSRNIHLEESAFSLLPRANGGSNQSFACARVWHSHWTRQPVPEASSQVAGARSRTDSHCSEFFCVDEAQSIIPLEINVINSRQKWPRAVKSIAIVFESDGHSQVCC